ncbi:MAG: hypothetical protein KDD51_12535, partial [Bdellovibrionales bacterium]|nr:hypothetical protein [Bdellovibrionales bacterium]
LFGCAQTDTSTAPSGAGACGQSPVRGRWFGAILGQPDVMEFGANCSGSSSYCGASFSYPNVQGTSGMVEIQVTGTKGKVGCLPKGKNTCAYAVRSSSLHFNCGSSSLTYVKE